MSSNFSVFKINNNSPTKFWKLQMVMAFLLVFPEWNLLNPGYQYICHMLISFHLTNYSHSQGDIRNILHPNSHIYFCSSSSFIPFGWVIINPNAVDFRKVQPVVIQRIEFTLNKPYIPSGFLLIQSPRINFCCHDGVGRVWRRRKKW